MQIQSRPEAGVGSASLPSRRYFASHLYSSFRTKSPNKNPDVTLDTIGNLVWTFCLENLNKSVACRFQIIEFKKVDIIFLCNMFFLCKVDI